MKRQNKNKSEIKPEKVAIRGQRHRESEHEKNTHREIKTTEDM